MIRPALKSRKVLVSSGLFRYRAQSDKFLSFACQFSPQATPALFVVANADRLRRHPPSSELFGQLRLRRTNLTGGAISDAEEVELLLNMVLNPRFKPGKEVLTRLAKRTGQQEFNPRDALPLLRFLHNKLGLSTLWDRIIAASDADWSRAHDLWLQGYRLLQRLSEAAGISRPEWRLAGYRLMYLLGPLGYVVILGLVLNDHEDMVRAALHSAEDWVADVEGHPDALRVFTLHAVVQRRIDLLADPRRAIPWKAPRQRRRRGRDPGA